jgi:hypothetical protein
MKICATKIIVSEAESIYCQRGKPAAIESQREYDYFLEIANTACKILFYE